MRVLNIADSENQETPNAATLEDEAVNLSQKEEQLRLGIKQRADSQGYRSCLVLPVNTGNLNVISGGQPFHQPVGLLGLDTPRANAFGDVTESELNFLASIADSMSILAQDIGSTSEKCP